MTQVRRARPRESPRQPVLTDRAGYGRTADKTLGRMHTGASALDSATRLMFSPNTNGTSSTNSVDGVANNTNTFFDKTASLMKALEHVGQIHPFAGGIVVILLWTYVERSRQVFCAKWRSSRSGRCTSWS